MRERDDLLLKHRTTEANKQSYDHASMEISRLMAEVSRLTADLDGERTKYEVLKREREQESEQLARFVEVEEEMRRLVAEHEAMTALVASYGDVAGLKK